MRFSVIFVRYSITLFSWKYINNGVCRIKKNPACRILRLRRVALATLFHSAAVRSLAERFLCHRTKFPMTQKIVHFDPIIQSTCTILNPLTNDHCLTSCAGSDELHWCLDIFLNEVNICLWILWKIFKGLSSGQIAKVTIKLFIYWFAVL